MIALRIFLIVVVGSALSGLVAFLGNKLGRQVGRRKMSIFGLRPKYTSNIITVATGSMIFMVTLGIMSAISSDVRTFLGGLDELKREQIRLQQEIAHQRKILGAGPIVLPFQPLALGVVQCGLSLGEMREQIDTLLQLANDNLLARNNQTASKYDLAQLSDESKLVGYVPGDKDGIIDSLRRAPKGSTVVCIVLAGKQTAYYNDKIEAQFLFQPNPVVFHRDQAIVSGFIDGRRTSAQVYTKIVEFIYKDLNYTCLEQYHMIRNPLSNKLDTSIDMFMMKRAADEIAKANRPMKLNVVANGEIHPLGPLDARLVVTRP